MSLGPDCDTAGHLLAPSLIGTVSVVRKADLLRVTSEWDNTKDPLQRAVIHPGTFHQSKGPSHMKRPSNMSTITSMVASINTTFEQRTILPIQRRTCTWLEPRASCSNRSRRMDQGPRPLSTPYFLRKAPRNGDNSIQFYPISVDCK